METTRQILETFQTLNVRAQVIVGILAALIVLGTISLFYLVALIPNASIGIVNLLSIFGGFAIGRVGKTLREK